MNKLKITPYYNIENETYNDITRLEIENSDFKDIEFKQVRSTFSFINCKFSSLEIENKENIEFNNISINFIDCYIEDIKIENFVTKNISLFFGSSIVSGIISSKHTLDIEFNNCLIRNSLFLSNLNNLKISYSDENIFIRRWIKLFYLSNTSFLIFTKINQYIDINDCKKITVSHSEASNRSNSGFYLNRYTKTPENRLGYHLSNEEKMRIQISLNITYSANTEHTSTKIFNGKLSSLSLKGQSTGDLLIENSKINNLYIHNFSTQNGTIFYNIKPFNKASNNNKVEIQKSNLDKMTFDNFSFDDYNSISFYRNKFGQTTITSCNFPKDYKNFEKFKTIENIHYPDRKDDNYYKMRYETFLQIKKQIELSGNFYEAQKFHSISLEALSKVETLPIWDKIILKLNSISNNHGIAIKEPFLLLLFTSISFYILYLWSIGRIFNRNALDCNLFGYYFAFLDITHRIDFLEDRDNLNGFSIAIDFLNKTVVGYLIYQFIAAFRKYGKK